MLISPFTPLYFGNDRSDGIESRFMQLFAPTDKITVQAIGAVMEDIDFEVVCADGSEIAVGASTYAINALNKLSYIELSGMTPGIYRVKCGGKLSNWFRVTDDESVLAKTVLIQYANKDNRSRTDVVFKVGYLRTFFDFRVPGGFKAGGWSFGVENEQFTTPLGDIVELYALESTIKTLTVGWQEGVPVWFADKLNRLLTCNYVYLDGVRYARNGSSVPELTVQMEGLDSFVVTQMLRQVANLDPEIENDNHVQMRRIDGTQMRTTEIDSTTYNRLI